MTLAAVWLTDTHDNRWQTHKHTQRTQQEHSDAILSSSARDKSDDQLTCRAQKRRVYDRYTALVPQAHLPIQPSGQDTATHWRFTGAAPVPVSCFCLLRHTQEHIVNMWRASYCATSCLWKPSHICHAWNQQLRETKRTKFKTLQQWRAGRQIGD